MNLSARWRKSLSVRIISGTSILIFGIVVGFALILQTQVMNSVMQAKVQDSLVDAVVGLDTANDVIDSYSRSSTGISTIVDTIVATLARRSGTPAAYQALLLSNGGGPERGTNLVLPSSVPPELIVQVFAQNSQQWTYTEIKYLDGSAAPAVAVGAPIYIGEQQYGLFLLYPTTQQQNLIDLVRSALIFISLLLIFSLIFVVTLVTKRITNPIRAAADTAQKIASGLLNERLNVFGEDEVARWAQSFNSMTDTLETQISQLEKLSVVQQRFVSDVSHELRTPVTTVRLAADLLHAKRDEFPPDVARAAELLQGELDRFEVMLSDLLEISRIDAGASPLQIASHKVTDVVQRVIDSVAPVAHAAEVSVNRISADEELLLQCDSRRIERALRNLVVNAISHSGTKNVDLVIEEVTPYCSILVIDYGVGLADDQKTHIFERFWRADESRARDRGGSGLGLSIAMEDIKQHNGEIKVKDNPAGAGLVFEIKLPVELDLRV